LDYYYNVKLSEPYYINIIDLSLNPVIPNCDRFISASYDN